ncbi:uncharacterized protein LTR77_010799 [Saxophila tyrrhenica]|uniref:Uncharacterized protein n=1 Tax=Saxophila tyrrhenica TaxID=1690608 RepID=A0AAV9NWS2_9PEZI|nr:hypothetical protein LTR77_010799 [Saxophila tyrrhenica]
MPQVVVGWSTEDLSLFTPASAPILPQSAIEAFVSPNKAASMSTGGSGSSGSAGAPPASPSQTSESNQSQEQDHEGGLSTGAKAGIGVGAAVLAFLLLAGAFWIFRRKRAGKSSVQRARSQRPYVDSKGQLEGNAVSRRDQEIVELPGKEAQEADSRPYVTFEGEPLEADSPPPIPLASKPRWELEGGFRGHEVGPRSPGADGSRGVV